MCASLGSQSPLVTSFATPAPFCGVVEELATFPGIESLFLSLTNQQHCIFFDSARRQEHLGRYSFLAANPFDFLIVTEDEAITSAQSGKPVFSGLAERLATFSTISVPGLPPFQGGLAAMFGYDLNRSLERIRRARYDEFAVPALAVGLYDVVLAIDHHQNKAWIVSQGWPEPDPDRRNKRAQQRLNAFKSWLNTSRQPPKSVTGAGGAQKFLPASALATQFPTHAGAHATSNFSQTQYIETIERAIEYIHAGDVFQVNLAQRLLHPANDDSVNLYLRMRQENPAPFAAYFDLGEFQIISASPERFLKLQDRCVEARPIKGTRRRSNWPEADLFVGDELLQSDKDRAENVMIVDLLRNDLSRVCTAESVEVSELCRLETYEFVQHLVSVVRGELRPGCGPFDLLSASFPGGSVTGAPKVRAMEIIAELEPTARGAYCGCIGYVGFDGTMDTNILIRTITAGRGWWQFPVGGGIVAQSDREREYEETWHKAEGMLRALK